MYQADIDEETFPWALSGPIDHLRADGALLVRPLLGQPVAAVREPAADRRLGRTTLPIPNNKSNVYYTASAGEAHYLVAFINSAPAQRALARFAVSTGVTPAALARLPIPPYDPADDGHAGLAGLGREATELKRVGDEAAVGEIETLVDEAVWRLVTS